MQKIMIIEDDPAIRDELALLLENEGYQPLPVTDFDSVPVQAAQVYPDLILLDINLPGRDGFTLCAALRKAVPAPVIFVTSRDSGADEVRALSLGGDDYITKPYSVPALLLVFGAVQVSDFLRQRARLLELNAILDGLDRKYLFAECAPPPKGIYERRLFELMRRAGRDMVGAVSDAQAAQREYREYVERWVHEIKAPITAARLICRELDGEQRRKLTAELARIEVHVERALFYARAENPEQDCLFRQVNLGEITAQAIEHHRSLLIQSGVRVETESLDCCVYTDEKWAVFILGQLLQNAARYRGKEPAITISAQPLGKQTKLTVRDNGIGIPAHELPRVFDRGFTGSNGRSRGDRSPAGSSTGMGLYLCKKLSGFLGLGLSVTSEEGKGTTVTLTFPAKENLTKL